MENTSGIVDPTEIPGRWSAEQAAEWYARQPWPVGCNYIPANAINQLEMFQADTFSPDVINQELTMAQDLGFNSLRVYLHDLLWVDDAEGLYERMDVFLNLCRDHGIRPLFVFFDDCHNDSPKLGVQPLPVPAYHNSGWVQSPGRAIGEQYATETIAEADRARLQGYVQETMRRFKDDERVLAWDLYNEPGRGVMPGEIKEGDPVPHFGDRSMRLLTDAWRWAREVAPSQPVFSTAEGSVGERNIEMARLNSDVFSFHSYSGPDDLEPLCRRYASTGRPSFCTEYMARPNSTFEACLPVLKKYRIAAYNWGFIAGKTGCVWKWGMKDGKTKDQLRAEGDVEPDATKLPLPEVWFHEIFHLDGTPYRESEVACIRELTGRAAQ